MNLISLVKPKVNRDLLDATQNITKNLFRAESQTTLFSYNKNKLINKRQHSRVLTTIWGDFIKIIKSAGSDLIG